MSTLLNATDLYMFVCNTQNCQWASPDGGTSVAPHVFARPTNMYTLFSVRRVSLKLSAAYILNLSVTSAMPVEAFLVIYNDLWRTSRPILNEPLFPAVNAVVIEIVSVFPFTLVIVYSPCAEFAWNVPDVPLT